MIFEYSARTRSGETRAGTIKAKNREEAINLLRKQGLILTSLREKKSIGAFGFGGKVKNKELAIFTKQFSVMIDAGLPLVQCLDILASQQENKFFANVLEQVRNDVEQGSTLADAMKKHPKVFDDLYTNLIAAGEAGGILDVIMQRLSIYIEKAYKLKESFKSAMTYPITVITIAVLIVALILWKVIPAFASMFAGLGAELPLPTRIVIKLSHFVVNFGFWIILFFILVFIGLRKFYQTETGRKLIDGFVLKLPILGIIFRKIAVARFSRTLATLVSSGVSILEGLMITAKTAGNKIVEDAVLEARLQVEQGKTISEPLKNTKVFPPMVVQMIGVGEQTGALDTMLSKIADFYEEEVDQAVAQLMSLLEPVMIVVLGGLVGGIVVSMYLPIFSLIKHIK
ncbi:type IV pilus assembly protein PilC [Thermotomaculum hydrothermale]|uniref:Type IV pilus assembly protein PilC n=1 Tax=Thermotomaculum hydrothermale TaxID=981385 RepID=A0A7R6SZU9_9BACT|nr:type II secretion system F family protein [Thermotomaculum hydrothermale]BBB33165.1 type IV pilus assembly protein PilC [Thermotomaculum hydrothermale]